MSPGVSIWHPGVFVWFSFIWERWLFLSSFDINISNSSTLLQNAPNSPIVDMSYGDEAEPCH